MNTNNANKRTFLNLDFIQGEEITLEFDVIDDCKQVYLDEYTLTGFVREKFNDTPVGEFTFIESEDSPICWVATLSSIITASLIPQTYTYEIRMQHKIDGKPDTLLYGTLTIKPTRLGA